MVGTSTPGNWVNSSSSSVPHSVTLFWCSNYSLGGGLKLKTSSLFHLELLSKSKEEELNNKSHRAGVGSQILKYKPQSFSILCVTVTRKFDLRRTSKQDEAGKEEQVEEIHLQSFLFVSSTVRVSSRRAAEDCTNFYATKTILLMDV